MAQTFDLPGLLRLQKEITRTKDFPQPTLTAHSYCKPKIRIENVQEFGEKMAEAIGMSIDLADFTIIGGSIVDILYDRTPNDIDLYYISSNDRKSFERRMLAFIKSIDRKANTIKYVRCLKNCYSIAIERADFREINIQVSMVSSLEEHLMTIDIPACKGYYRKTKDDDIILCFPEDAAKSLSLKAITVDTTNISRKYLLRLIKYHDQKKFDLILPGLPVEKIPTVNLDNQLHQAVRLNNFLCMVVRTLEKNKITGCLRYEKSEDDDRSNLDYNTDFTERLDSMHAALEHNINCLVTQKYDEAVWFGEGDDWENAFRKFPITTKDIGEFYKDHVFDRLDLRKNTLGIVQKSLAMFISNDLRENFDIPTKDIDNKIQNLLNQQYKRLRIKKLKKKETYPRLGDYCECHEWYDGMSF